MKSLREQAIQISSDETRSFDELYGQDNKLFEDIEKGEDGLIDPRMKKLFESVYSSAFGERQRLSESINSNTFNGEPINLKDPKFCRPVILPTPEWKPSPYQEDKFKTHTNADKRKVSAKMKQFMEEVCMIIPNTHMPSPSEQAKITSYMHGSGVYETSKLAFYFTDDFATARKVADFLDQERREHGPLNESQIREELSGEDYYHKGASHQDRVIDDGVPAAHNKAGLGGEDTATAQGQGRGDSNNAKLFEGIFKRCNESIDEDITDPGLEDLVDEDILNSDLEELGQEGYSDKYYGDGEQHGMGIHGGYDPENPDPGENGPDYWAEQEEALMDEEFEDEFEEDITDPGLEDLYDEEDIMKDWHELGQNGFYKKYYGDGPTDYTRDEI